MNPLGSIEFGNGLSDQCTPRGERAVWCDEGPSFIFNRIEVSGPDELLYDFIGAASGPGFVDWRPERYSVYEQIYFSGVRGGAPTRGAAEHLARKLRDILWRRHEEERVRAELDSHRVPLDLNALFPIPRRIRRKGFGEAAQEWMWRNWGVRWPIRRVTFVIERRETSGVKPVAVYRFLSEDWPPSIALLRMRERWPELRFEMKVGYVMTDGDLPWSGTVVNDCFERKRTGCGAT